MGITIFAAVGIFLAHCVRAGEPSVPVQALDLGALIDLGLSKNPRTRAAWFQARALDAATSEAKAAYFPKVSAAFAGGYDKWYTPAVNAPDDFRRRQATTVLSIEYLLLDFGRRAADVSRAVSLLNSAGLSFERRIQEVVFQIQRSYFAHEAALVQLQAATAMLAFAQTVEATVKWETSTGLSSNPDLLRAKKTTLNCEYELEAAQALVHTTLGDVCVAVGLPANAPVRLASAEMPVSTGDLREKAGQLIEQALASRPDLAARAADVSAREADTRRAVADFFPEVKIEGNYAYSAFQYNAAAGDSRGDHAQGVNGYGAFLTAKWDLFDGFARVAQERKRRDEENASREELVLARLDATRDVWSACQTALASARRVDYAEGFVASAKENFESVSLGYEGGLHTVAEISEAASQLAVSRSARAVAVAEYSTSLASLALAVGQPVPEKPAALDSYERDTK